MPKNTARILILCYSFIVCFCPTTGPEGNDCVTKSELVIMFIMYSNKVVSISAFFSVLCSFLNSGIYSSKFSCFPFYCSDVMVIQKPSK